MAWSALVSGVRLGRGRRVRFAARRPAQPLELWELEACPFCRKVREVLSELDLEYVCHPVARGSAHRSETPTYAGGRKSYPYLVDPNTGAAMKESEDIIDYLLSEYGPGAGARWRRLAPIHTLGSIVASAIRPRGRAVRAGISARSTPREPLVLYSFEGCPYCRRVRERLHALDLVHLVKNAAKGSARRAELVAIGGRAKVPFLIDPQHRDAALRVERHLRLPRDHLRRAPSFPSRIGRPSHRHSGPGDHSFHRRDRTFESICFTTEAQRHRGRIYLEPLCLCGQSE
ncbi:MAG: glutathione S-transferase N-terminal domain-containing protein [Sandaracinaceae bacterium]|nr:glutathione S-transferase N-terminal domain-containing protein [Sandaracinaceae bacterium]